MENVENNEKKSKKGLVIAIIGVLLIVIIAVVFLLVPKDNKTKKNTPSSNSSTNTNTNEVNDDENNDSNENDEELKPLSETEKLMMLFPPIEKAYQNKLLKAGDFEINDLLANSIDLIDKSELYFAGTDETYNACSNDSLKYTAKWESGEEILCYNKNIDSGDIAFEEKTLKKYFEMFYGNEVKYKRLDNITTLGTDYWYQNGYYFGITGGGGYGIGPGTEFEGLALNKVETTDTEKYIYVYYAYGVFSCKDEDCNNFYVTLYKDNKKQEKISDAVKLNDSVDNTREQIALTAGDKAAVYKHTYKKSVDGSYYWYSVEPVK